MNHPKNRMIHAMNSWINAKTWAAQLTLKCHY
jgi:hypothetical protein